jgi:hypothetical protein
MNELKLTYNIAPILFWIIPIALIVGGICLKIELKGEGKTEKEGENEESNTSEVWLSGLIVSCATIFLASMAWVTTLNFAYNTMRVIKLDGAKVMAASITNGSLRVQIGVDGGTEERDILGEIVEVEVNPQVITVGERTINALEKMDFKLGDRSIAELRRDAVLAARNQK